MQFLLKGICDCGDISSGANAIAEGTKHAAVLINISGKDKTRRPADLKLSCVCTDLLDEKELLHEVTVENGDAVLLVSKEEKQLSLSHIPPSAGKYDCP